MTLQVLETRGLLCLSELRAWSRYQETDEQNRSCRTETTSSRTAICYKERKEEHCQSSTTWPPADHWCTCFYLNCQKETPRGCHEGLTSTTRPCAHSEHRAAWLTSAIVHQNWHIPHWCPGLFTERAGSLTLPVLGVGQWWSGEAFPWGAARSSTC